MASTTYNSMDLFQGNLHRKLAGVYGKYETPPSSNSWKLFNMIKHIDLNLVIYLSSHLLFIYWKKMKHTQVICICKYIYTYVLCMHGFLLTLEEFEKILAMIKQVR